MAKEKAEDTPVEKYTVGEIPTETQPIIYDTVSKEQYNLMTAMAKLMNDIEKLKKLLD